VGVEGLPVEAGRHYLAADTAEAFAENVVTLLEDDKRRGQMAADARQFVERHFSYTVAAGAFEDACHLAIERFRRKPSGVHESQVN